MSVSTHGRPCHVAFCSTTAVSISEQFWVYNTYYQQSDPVVLQKPVLRIAQDRLRSGLALIISFSLLLSKIVLEHILATDSSTMDVSFNEHT